MTPNHPAIVLAGIVDLQPGLLVTPSIRLAYMLGRGGMGSVWLAEHLRLRVKVVVKFIAAEHVDDPHAVTRFEREAAAAASAKSPHVVQILDFGVTDFGLPFIAMEFLEGEDLGKRLSRERRVAPALFADWLGQICKGLTRIHAAEIVHRDIKPENIFLSNIDGEVFVKLLDFGIAKANALSHLSGGTHTQAFIGTLQYMSPEQTMGAKAVDHRTDLWALGVVTYRALTGSRPFEADAIGGLIEAIRTSPIRPPSSLVPELGAPIDAWMQRALARQPEQRFSSAREMALAFAQALHALGHTAPRYFSDPPPPSAPPAAPMVLLADSARNPAEANKAAAAAQTTPPSSITLDSQDREVKRKPAEPRIPRAMLAGAAAGVVLAVIGTYFWSDLQPAAGPGASTSTVPPANAPTDSATPPRVEPGPPTDAATSSAAVTAGPTDSLPTQSPNPSMAPGAGSAAIPPTRTNPRQDRTRAPVSPSPVAVPPVRSTTNPSSAGVTGSTSAATPPHGRPVGSTRPAFTNDDDLR